jgi:hypothetical protein
MIQRRFVLNVNPEPWAIGDLDVGRSKSGKQFARVAPNHQLVAFQEAVRGELEEEEGFPEDLNYKLTFYFWRRLDWYLDASDRKRYAHQADATNMQKGLEDALQGTLFDNDRDVHDIRSVVVEQGPNINPRILIVASEAPRLADVYREIASLGLTDELLAAVVSGNLPRIVNTQSVQPDKWRDADELF